MNISEKLNLQHQFKGILLFKEGVFLRSYNQGAYVLTQLFGYALKLQTAKLKKYQNRWVIACAFPLNKLSERLPEAVLTDFGAKLECTYQIDDYQQWYERRCREESRAKVKAKASNESLQTNEKQASEQSAVVYLNNNYVKLTSQQIAYLRSWQSGAYPIDVDRCFIESLKNKLLAGLSKINS